MRGGRMGSLAASPTLVGAVTVLVVVVAVFLSYQANQGLPFVPTYKLSAELPNADSLVPGNDVRIGGIRVGQIKSVDPETVNNAPCPNDPTRQCTTQVAKVNMELNQSLDPLPENSTLVVRAKSALGLKYLEINRGNSSQGFKPGATVPVTSARPEPVEIDQVFNMFDAPTRTAIQSNLLEFGNALAGRGGDLNEAIGQLKPLVQVLTPVMRNLADPNTGLGNFVSSLSATAAEVAPVAEIQGQLFVDLDTTFGAFARVSRPFIQETIEKSPSTEDTTIATLPTIRPLLANTAKLFSELRPGFHALAPNQKALGQSVVEGVKALALAPAFNAQLDPTAQAVLNLSNNAGARPGDQRPDHVQQHPGAAALLHHPGTVDLQLRDAALPQRGELPRLRRRDRHQPAVHRPAAADRAEQRDRPKLRAGQRRRPEHQFPALQPVSEHRGAGADA